MDDSTYSRLVTDTFGALLDAFEEVDPDLVDVISAGDVLTLTYADKSSCVVNTQRPTQQIWLAGRRQAWHFSYDDAKAQWLDDKGRGDELFATLARLTHEVAGVRLAFKR